MSQYTDRLLVEAQCREIELMKIIEGYKAKEIAAKQQERREFVARAATNTFCDDSWNSSWDEIVLYSIALWEEYDKQLTELEQSEEKK